MQLGATVDYGILLTQYYLDRRQHLLPKDAARQSITDAAASLVSPAMILAAVSFTLMGISTNAVVKEIGLVLGRGALISLAMVLFFLPGLLILTDRLIEKTTMNTNFMPKPRKTHKGGKTAKTRKIRQPHRTAEIDEV